MSVVEVHPCHHPPPKPPIQIMKTQGFTHSQFPQTPIQKNTNTNTMNTPPTPASQPVVPTMHLPSYGRQSRVLPCMTLMLLFLFWGSSSYGQCPTAFNAVSISKTTISNGFSTLTDYVYLQQPVAAATNSRCWTTLAGTPPLRISVYDGNTNYRTSSTSTLNANGTTTTCVNNINSIPNGDPITGYIFFIVTFVVTDPTTGVVDPCNTTYNSGIINNLVTPASLSVNFVRVGIESDCSTSTLSWHVSDEINVSHYQVERSLDGEQFEPIGSVKATGAAQYRYTDRSTRAAYYRIAEYETTGERGNSTAILYKKSCQNTTLQVYPNPATDVITLVGSGEVQISNLLGQILISDTPWIDRTGTQC